MWVAWVSGLPGCIVGTVDIPAACFRIPDIEIAPLVDERTGIDGLGEALYEEQARVVALEVPVVAFSRAVVHDGFRDVPRELRRHGLDLHARLHSVAVVARESLRSLGELTAVSVDVEPLDQQSGLRRIQLGSCNQQGRACSTGGTRIELESRAELDVLPYLDEDRLRTTVSMVGEPPIWTWVFDVEVCFEAEGDVRAGL